MTHDIIVDLTGIDPESDEALSITAVRQLRAQARDNAQLSFEALLEGDSPDLPLAERLAIAAFVASLHGDERARTFYLDLYGDEGDADSLTDFLPTTSSRGPYGVYAEAGLKDENQEGPWYLAPHGLNPRLAAAFGFAHLLTLHPRDANPTQIAALAHAGFSADAVVSLAQLISFLAFQLRVVHGLREIAGVDSPVLPTADPAPLEGSAPTASLDGGAFSVLTPHVEPTTHFVSHSLGWHAWVPDIPKDELSAEQIDALIDPQRANMPYFRLLARDPAALKARTLTDLDIFFNTNGGVGRAERELAATVTSRLNGCVYCASVHSARAIAESGREADVERLLSQGVDADLGSSQWNAISKAAVALTQTPIAFGQPELQALRDAGYQLPEIVDIINAAAFFNWANRLMLGLGEPELPARFATGAGKA